MLDTGPFPRNGKHFLSVCEQVFLQITFLQIRSNQTNKQKINSLWNQHNSHRRIQRKTRIISVEKYVEFEQEEEKSTTLHAKGKNKTKWNLCNTFLLHFTDLQIFSALGLPEYVFSLGFFPLFPVPGSHVSFQHPQHPYYTGLLIM